VTVVAVANRTFGTIEVVQQVALKCSCLEALRYDFAAYALQHICYPLNAIIEDAA
jgi:hypothetical protein